MHPLRAAAAAPCCRPLRAALQAASAGGGAAGGGAAALAGGRRREARRWAHAAPAARGPRPPAARPAAGAGEGEFEDAGPLPPLPAGTRVVNTLRPDQIVRGVPVARIDEEGRGVVGLLVRRDKQLYEFTYDRALPGEKLHLRVAQAKHDRFQQKKVAGRYRLALEERGAASPDEVDPLCDHFSGDKCGGCTFQHLAYRAQLREKLALLERRLEEYGLRGTDVRPPIASPSAYGFHGRTEFRFFLRDGLHLGLHPVGDPVPLSVARCRLHPPASQRAFEATLAACRAEPEARAFDERTGRGWLCSAAFRAAPAGAPAGCAEEEREHKVLVTLATIPGAPEACLRRLAEAVVAGCNDVVGVTWSAEAGEPAVRAPGWRNQGGIEHTVLAGAGRLVQHLRGIPFELAPEASSRPNVLLADAVCGLVEELAAGARGRGASGCGAGVAGAGDARAGGSGVVWDAFSGQGTLVLPLLVRGRFAQCVALDRAGPALGALRQNGEAHGVGSRVRAVRADLGHPGDLRALAVALPGGAPCPPPRGEAASWAADDEDADGDDGAAAADASGVAAAAAAGDGGGATLALQLALEGPLPGPDVLIADPGRNGMPKAFRTFLYEARVPRIVYLGSGRPFLRDCVLLGRRGYQLRVVAPFDTQPHAARLEVAACLEYVPPSDGEGRYS